MKIKLNNWFFYLLILIQLQLDLLLFKYNLCGLFALLVFLFIFNKKQVWICNLFTFLAFMLMQFIINTNLIQLALAQVVISFFACQILKKNIISKIFSYYLVLISSLILSNYFANTYIFNIIFDLSALLPQITLNLIYGTILLILGHKFLLEN
jgi:hypothetical protein